MVVLKRAFDQKAIFQFLGNQAMLLGVSFLVIFTQANIYPTQDDCHCDVKTIRLAQDSTQAKLEKIQEIFLIFQEKCAEYEAYDKILVNLDGLLSIVEEQLKSEDSSKITLARRSIAAKSKIFKISRLLVKTSQQNSVKSLKSIYFPVSKIFGWNGKTRKSLFEGYRKRRQLKILKRIEESRLFKVIAIFGTLTGVLFTSENLIRLASKSKMWIFGKPKGGISLNNAVDEIK